MKKTTAYFKIMGNSGRGKRWIKAQEIEQYGIVISEVIGSNFIVPVSPPVKYDDRRSLRQIGLDGIVDAYRISARAYYRKRWKIKQRMKVKA